MQPEHLAQFLIRWRSITSRDCDVFESALNSATSEREMQIALEENPLFLLQHLAASSHFWVIPQRRLGSEFITDFMLAEDDGDRVTWTAVELERPSVDLFTVAGNPTSTLTHALRQISDWRNWLSRNRAYASAPPSASGLGLTDVDPELDGLIIIGRDSSARGSQEDRRRRMARESRVRIQTYDWLLRQARRTAVTPGGMNDIFSAFFGESSRERENRKPNASDILRKAFGGIGSVSTLGTIRSHDWDQVTIEMPSGDFNVVVESVVDYAPTTSKPQKTITKYDWLEWIESSPFSNFNEDRSLLVAEYAPGDDLLADMTEEGDGVWRDKRFESYRVDLLVYLPPELAESEREHRIDIAKQVLMREIVRLNHVPDSSVEERDS